MNQCFQKEKWNVDVTMLGSRMHYAVPSIFVRSGILCRFYTDIYLGNKRWVKRLFKILKMNHWSPTLLRLYGRTADDIPPEKVVSFDLFGIWYWWKSLGIHSSRDMIGLYARANKTFGNNVIRHGLGGANAVYGFNGASLEIFQFAKQ